MFTTATQITQYLKSVATQTQYLKSVGLQGHSLLINRSVVTYGTRRVPTAKDISWGQRLIRSFQYSSPTSHTALVASQRSETMNTTT